MSSERSVLEKGKQFRPMTLEELARRPLDIKRFSSRIVKGDETHFAQWPVLSVAMEATGKVEFRLHHPKHGMKDVILENGRLYQKWDNRDITHEFTPETTSKRPAQQASSEEAA